MLSGNNLSSPKVIVVEIQIIIVKNENGSKGNENNIQDLKAITLEKS